MNIFKHHKLKFNAYTIVFLTVVFSVFSIDKSFSQKNNILDSVICIKANKLTINELLETISNKTGYYFTYDTESALLKDNITFSEQKKTVKSLLNQYFQDSIFDFKIIKNQIVIHKKKNVSIQDSKLQKRDSISFFILKGKLKDFENKESLPFVSLNIQNTALGTISNEQGEFVFKIPKEYIDSTICFSTMGYVNISLPAFSFLESGKIIQMHKHFYSIQEVIVRYTDPRILIQTALKKKSENYLSKDALFTTFYREFIKKNDRYLSYIESVLQVYKSSYSKPGNEDKIKIFKIRKTINSLGNDTIILKLKSGPNSSLTLDFMHEPIDFLSETGMNDYDYRSSGIMLINDESAYCIDFVQKTEITEPLYKGTIYISTNSMAIVAADFEINQDYISLTDDKFIVKKGFNIKTKTVYARYHVSYRKVNSKYVLNHVRADLMLKIKKKRNIFSANYNILFESVVCNVKTDNVRKFKKDELFTQKNILSEIPLKYDAEFWGEDNYINPETPVQETIVKLNLQK